MRLFGSRRLILAGCVVVLMCPTIGNAQTPPPANPAAAAPKLLAQKFDDWTWRCVAPAGGAAPTGCEVAQAVKVNQEGKTVEVLNLAVSKATDKAGKVEYALVALTPLDVHLPSQFGLLIGDDKAKGKDKQKPILTQYRNCNQMGCFVVMPIDAATVSKFKQAQEGAGFFRLINGKTVKVVFSLKGFDKAIDALASKELPPAAVAAAAPVPPAAPSK